MSKLIRVAVPALAVLSVATAAAAQSSSWQIGPIIRGQNYSVGMPLQPTRTTGGWFFDFPVPEAEHVHYVTANAGSLAGATRITVRYRIDAARGARFIPQQFPDEQATVSLYLQRAGDNWSARRQFEHYRWYAPVATKQAIDCWQASNDRKLSRSPIGLSYGPWSHSDARCLRRGNARDRDRRAGIWL